MAPDRSENLPRPQPCLTRRDGVVCEGTLLPVTDREWRCTEGHTMWGTARAMRSEPWTADRVQEPPRPLRWRWYRWLDRHVLRHLRGTW